MGGFGALHANLAHPMELPIAQDVETASIFEGAQSSERSHLARRRGNLQLVKDEPIEINRDRLR